MKRRKPQTKCSNNLVKTYTSSGRRDWCAYFCSSYCPYTWDQCHILSKTQTLNVRIKTHLEVCFTSLVRYKRNRLHRYHSTYATTHQILPTRNTLVILVVTWISNPANMSNFIQIKSTFKAEFISIYGTYLSYPSLNLERCPNAY